MSGAPAPVDPADRIASIDALRGVALIGILLMNIVGFGGPLDPSRPLGAPSLANPDWQVWIVATTLVEGTMRGLFSMLFGAGMLLFLRETRAGDPAGRRGPFLRRAGWLVLFGVINGTLLLWPGDILLIYGLAAFALLPFARATPRTLLRLAVGGLVVVSIWSLLTNMPAMPGELLSRTSEAWIGEQAIRLGDYPTVLAWMSATTLDWTLDPSFVWWILEAWTFMLIGMALLRTGVLDGRVEPWIYRQLALVGLGVGLLLNAAETWAIWGNNGGELPWTALTDQVGRLALTLGWIGLFHLAWRGGRPRRLFNPLSALGRMALTGYLAQSVICALIFSGFGLGLWGRLSWPQMWLLVVVIMAGEALFAMAWLRVFRFGPMEWLWRSLTWGRWQPMRV